MKTIKDKHEQLYVAVQDLLIELGVTPKRLRDIAANKTHNSINPKTAQKLIDAGIIVEEINWRMPGNVLSVKDYPLTTFNKIKSDLAPIILWSYLQEEHPEFLLEQVKEYLFPTQ